MGKASLPHSAPLAARHHAAPPKPRSLLHLTPLYSPPFHFHFLFICARNSPTSL